MKTNKLAFTVAISLTVLAGQAQDIGPFLSFGAGMARTAINDLPAGWSSNQSDVTLALKGGYGFTPNLGVEVGYQNFGDIKLSKSTGSVTGSSTIHGTGWMLGAYASYPVTNEIDVLARAGWCDWSINQKSEFSSGGSTQVSTFKQTGDDAYFGLGTSWRLSPTMAVGLNWTRFKAPSNSGIFGSTDVVDVSLTQRF